MILNAYGVLGHKIKWEEVTALNVGYLYRWNILQFFSIIPENTDIRLQSWHAFQYIVTVEIGILHSSPFTNSHLHFLIVVESATIQASLRRPKPRPVYFKRNEMAQPCLVAWQQPNFWRDRIFKLTPISDRCVELWWKMNILQFSELIFF
jgi:hypothetical protein